MTANPSRRSPKPVRAENTRLLITIGALVRNERAKRAVTRRTLAQQCNTSERYLAQIETGEANPSVLVLDSIARALGVDPVDLMPAPRRNATIVHSPSARGRRIALVGLRGAGKSTLGAMLAARLACPFIELDKTIEWYHGAPVAALFDVYGQATFRRYERDALVGVVETNQAAVIATAGGIVADEATLAQLLGQTHVIWLTATPAEHMRRVMEQGDFRPMAHNRNAMNDLVAILDARAADYGRAHARLDTAGKSVEACVGELVGIATRLFEKPSS